jgi:ParB/RepB/Spo0J family partition protein
MTTDPVETLVSIPLRKIAPSPGNPRAPTTDADVADLAASIKHDGVLQPLLVRSLGDDRFEVVFGHRRLHAARLAGLKDVPCRVREHLPDNVVARLQLVENMQRQDLHPLDEADGLLALHKIHGLTIEQMVKQTGKGRTAIYARLKLVTLQDDARAAFRAGKMDAEVATLVARVPRGPQQTAALKVATEAQWDGTPPSYRKVRGELLQRFTEGLKAAPFDITDATLLEGISPQPIACTACPRRTGAAVDIFGDIVAGEHVQYGHPQGPDVCTDPACYDAKKRAHLKRQADQLRAKGKTVITGPAASKALSKDHYNDKINVKGDYIALADVRAEIKASKADVEVVTLQHVSGKTVQAVKAADLRAAGIKVKSADDKRSTSSPRNWEQERKRDEAAAARLQAQHLAIFAALKAAVLGGSPVTAHDRRHVVEELIDCLNLQDMPDLPELQRQIDTLDADALQRWVLLLIAATDIEVEAWHVNAVKRKPPPLIELAKRHGVDVAALRADKAPESAAPAAPPEKKPAAKKATPMKASPKQAAGATPIVPAQAWPFPGDPKSVTAAAEAA